ncbi:hypothetical protein RHSIM_Rhsim07G0014600 [Rhododendron simsii]|uniref:RING-type E3 ubiquitin transferase n=1 Tax=Rhododendron simsii TaxID=118357 RepID=A0A834GQ04_RHOSS|nr:hypothetical protein RHSIM_Rhsim07G0014600 [Rhododendron simsii]
MSAFSYHKRYPGIGISEMMASGSEIMEESPPRPVQVDEEKMYIAVGKDIKENTSVLIWALRNAGGRQICILHVHEPAQWIRISKFLDSCPPYISYVDAAIVVTSQLSLTWVLLGTKFPVSQLEAHHVRAHREVERQEMNNLLQIYKTKCSRAGNEFVLVLPDTVVDVLHIEMNSIEKGIVKLINQHGIRKLVMGAAADKHYSKKMPKSKKAIYVREQAPMFCHIWFVCKGQLVHTSYTYFGFNEELPLKLLIHVTYPYREGRSEGVSASPNSETGQSRYGRSQSVVELPIDRLKLTSSSPDIRSLSTLSPNDSRGSVDSNEISRSPREASHTSCSSVDMPNVFPLIPVLTIEDHSSPPNVLEGCMNDEPYYQLEQSIAEAETSRREAFDESMRRHKAQKDAIDAIRRAKALENLYAEELRQRKEVEEALARGKEELKQRKQQVGDVTEELRIALEHISSLESQIANSERMVEDLEQKMFSAVEKLQKNKKERDELQKEHDDALKEAEKLRREKAGAAANRLAPELFSEFSFSEIVEATSNFDLSLKIGEGGYGNIYKGQLRHTQVAIKMLNSNSMQGPSEFQQEVTVLSKLLTGRPALGIAKEVKYALDKGNLKNLLDPTAGDWPFVQAQQLAHTALRKSCKIHMHVAADGYTYELETLKGWLDGGHDTSPMTNLHDTSPMTNLELPHCNLVPNRALRSAIQEWPQQR